SALKPLTPYERLWRITGMLFKTRAKARAPKDDSEQLELPVQVRDNRRRVGMPGGPTLHVVRAGDARELSFIETESVHLVCTSPPYAMLKSYPDHPGQLGNIAVYDDFLDELDRVWKECL